MAKDWEAYEARIRENIDQRFAQASERARRTGDRAQRKAERMKERYERHARRASERAAQGAAGHRAWPTIGVFGFDSKSCNGVGSEPGIWVGVIILAVGIGLLLEGVGLFAFEDLVRFWPIFLIVAGGLRIGRARFPSAQAFGFVLLAAGVILLLGNLGVVHVSWNLFWPAILILVGIKHLMRSFDPPVAQQTAGKPAPPAPPQPPPPANSAGDWNTGSRGAETPTSGPRASNDIPPPPRADFSNASANPAPGGTTTTLGPDVYLHEYCIFTGGKRRIVCDNFRGGELVAAFGGIDVDLRNCIMGGDQATIDVTAAFGGCTIRVPLNWYVEMRCVAAFGGSSNKTIPPRGGPGQRIPKLTITGSAAFGGVVVEN